MKFNDLKLGATGDLLLSSMIESDNSIRKQLDEIIKQMNLHAHEHDINPPTPIEYNNLMKEFIDKEDIKD